MALIVDASAVLAVVLDQGSEEYSLAIAEKLVDEMCLAPNLFWFEVGSALVVQVKGGHMTLEGAYAALESIVDQEILTDQSADLFEIARLADKHRLSFYDAAYLELAVRRKYPVATLDRELQRAVKAEGLILFEPT